MEKKDRVGGVYVRVWRWLGDETDISWQGWR